jgi:ribosome-binding factor A
LTRRPDQVASLIQRAVQAVLSRGLGDPRIRGLVSVTKVRLDHALTQAEVFVSVLPGEHGELTLTGLQHAAPRIQSAVGETVQLRRVPRISFHLDESIKKQAAFDAALAEARRDDATEETGP